LFPGRGLGFKKRELQVRGATVGGKKKRRVPAEKEGGKVASFQRAVMNHTRQKKGGTEGKKKTTTNL